MVKTLHFQCRWCRFNPWSGNQAPISHMEWPKKKKKAERHTHSTGQKPREWGFGTARWKHMTLLLVKDHSYPPIFDNRP